MNVIISNKTFSGEYLTEPQDLERGMMGRETLDGCMVFKLNKGHHSFWMKGCKIPLDIVFILNNHISKIHHNCQPCDDCSERFTGLGDHVIEFPSGTCSDWKIGEKVYLGTPMNPVR